MTQIKEHEASKCDPVLFMQGFRHSAAYLSAFDLFFAGKQLSADATEHEKIEAFERSTSARNALIDYAEHSRQFSYCPDLFTAAARERMADYVSLVSQIQSRNSPAPDEIEEMDRARTACHLKVAQQLVADRVAPNVLLGRVLARLVLISEGLESYQDARAMR